MDILVNVFTPLVAFASLGLSLFTLWINRRRWSRELHAKFLERIMERRIASYPQLWAITSSVYRQSPHVADSHYSQEWASELLGAVSDWYYQQGHGIFMNEDSRSAFLAMHRALWTFQPQEGRDAVKHKVDTLRAEMRRDLKLEDRGREEMEI